MKSTWKPDQPLNKILSGLSKFEYARKRQFIPQHKKLDLTKFQVGILKKICNTKKIIIAHTVKNIGPVGVDIKQYIRWGLQEQLLDLKTYQLLSEEKAKIAANQPCSTIYQWGRKIHYDYVTAWPKTTKEVHPSKIQDATSYTPLDTSIWPLRSTRLISLRPVCSNLASLAHSLG